jgi:hypothetical protein
MVFNLWPFLPMTGWGFYKPLFFAGQHKITRRKKSRLAVQGVGYAHAMAHGKERFSQMAGFGSWSSFLIWH